MPEKACQNPLTSPVWPKKGSCPPGDSSLFLCLGVGRGDIFPNRKNRWRKARRARGQHGLPWGPPQKGRGAGMVRRQGGALCVVDYRLMHGRGTPGKLFGGRTRGLGAAGQGRWREGAGSGIALENHFEEGGRGVDGRQGAAGQGRLREGRGGGIASENHFEEGSAGWTGAAGQERLWEGAGGGITSENHLEGGGAGCRARRETTRRKKCRAKRKRRPGPPYLWYLEFCKIWKPR